MITKRKQYIDNYRNKILQHTDSIWIPNHNVNYENIETNSCYDIKIHETNNPYVELPFNNFTVIGKDLHKCKKIKMILTNNQKVIIQRWCHSYIMMYNAALYFIRKNIKFSDIKEHKTNIYDRMTLQNNIKENIIPK